MITNLTTPIVSLLEQVQDLLEQLSDQQFTQSLPVLSGASIGQHARHILEFYVTLVNGYEEGLINYDARKRDPAIETDRRFAIQCLRYIINQVMRDDKPLHIQGDYGIEEGNAFTIPTNYCRELMYNLEHTVHHMAFIRIGVSAFSSVVLTRDFGIAISTMKYRSVCAR